MKGIPGHSARGLCVTGLLILVAGAIAVYILKEYGDSFTREKNIHFAGMLTIIGSGVCFIAATARWWMRR